MSWLKAGLRTLLQPREINLASRGAVATLDEIEAGRAPLALLPFVALMQDGGEDGIIQRRLQLTQREKDKYRREDLGLVLVFAEAAERLDRWHKALEDWQVIESKVVNEWTRQAVERAQAKSKIDDTLDILQDRLGTPPNDLAEAIRSTTDLTRLRKFVLLAARVATYEQFRQDAGL